MEFLSKLIEDVYASNGKARNGRTKFMDFLFDKIKEDGFDADNDGWGNKVYSRKDILKWNLEYRAEKLGIDLNGDLSEEEIEIMKKEAKKGAKQLVGCLSNAQDNGGFNYWASHANKGVLLDLSKKSEDKFQFYLSDEDNSGYED